MYRIHYENGFMEVSFGLVPRGREKLGAGIASVYTRKWEIKLKVENKQEEIKTETETET